VVTGHPSESQQHRPVCTLGARTQLSVDGPQQ